MPDDGDKYKGMTQRDLLIRIATKVDVVVEQEIPELKEEDRRLHHRVNVVHGRVNKIKLISGAFVAAGSAIGSFIGWITTKGGN